MGYMICRHIKSNGSKCEAPALRGKPYCYFHMRLHRAQHKPAVESDAALGSAPKAPSDISLDVPAIEDRTAVQIALTQVLQGLGSKHIDSRRASQLLYGLQIASQLLERPKRIFQSEYVRSLTTTHEGDELAPKKFVCDKDDDCNKCPYATKDQCTRWYYIGKKDEASPAEDVDDDDDDDDADDDE